jgi:hypothetical protein
MRKLILVAAMVLVSAAAQAGPTRTLTVAANDEPVAVEPAKPAVEPAKPASEPAKAIEAPKETPAYTERPPAVDTSAPPAKADDAKPSVDKPVQKADRARRRHRSIEARVINELHRHGIYW